jgi:hypothetical protein
MGQVALPKVHWEALTAETLQASRRVGGLHFIDEFYLARGTGSALHHGHRFSMDLDFFSAASEAVGAGVSAELRGTREDPTPWAEMKQFLESQAMAAGREHLEDLWG